MKKPKRVLFDADFGCGKTLLMKHSACRLAKEIEKIATRSETFTYDTKDENTDMESEKEKHPQPAERPNVFFVSLTAAKDQEVDETTWRRPAVIDVANEMDFLGTGVKVFNY